jgi:flavin-dependent dehydrogenase
VATALSSIEPGGWDALVVGAGPAGCVAAASIAARGLRTLLVDRAAFPRPKVCGGCLAPAGVAALTDAGLGESLRLAGAAPVSTLRLIARGSSLSLPLKPYVTVERCRFDDALAQSCVERGVRFLDGVEAKLLDPETVELQAGAERIALRPGAIIVADGLGGTALSGRPEFRWTVKEHSPVGLGATLDAPPAHAGPDAITMVCGRGGYVGAAPLPGGRWALAAAVAPWLVRRDGPAGAIDSLLAESGLGPVSPGPVRLRGVGNLTRRRAASRGRVLFVGDAAGYVQPLTGEGMSWAIACAARIGPYAEAVGRGADAAGAWGRECSRTLGVRRVVCRAVCAAAARPWVLDAVFRLGALGPAPGWASRGLCWGRA